MQTKSLSREGAETVALKCLAWLAADDALLAVFMGASGARAADLRARAQDPEFLGAVLDFVLMDDARVLAFCRAEGLAAELPMAARNVLAGPAQMHWT